MASPWVGGGHTYTYKKNGLLATATVPRVAVTYGYDSRGNLLTLSNQLGVSPTFYNVNYTSMTYDAADNLTGVTVAADQVRWQDTLGTFHGAPSASGQITYVYDSKDRLIGDRRTATGSGGSGVYDYSNGTFDVSGNLTAAGYVYDTAENLTTLRGTVIGSSGYNANDQISGTGYAYNGSGAPTTYASAGLGYDPEMRLETLTSSGGSLLYRAKYRGDGLRAWRQTSTTTTYFIYDGDRVLCELESNGTSVVAKKLYGWGATGLSQRYDVSTSYGYLTYAYDPAGNVCSRVKPSANNGVPEDVAVYDGYGGLQADVSTGAIFSGGTRYTYAASAAYSVGFGGQWGYYTDFSLILTSTSDPNHNLDRGLILCTNRVYDPLNAKWLTRDPIGYEGGINLYSFVDGNPVMRCDPMGVDGFNDLSNLAAGYGDVLSFGGTKIARKYVGLLLGIGDANEAVNYNSGAYSAGQIAGTVHGLVEGGAGAVGLVRAVRAAGGSRAYLAAARTAWAARGAKILDAANSGRLAKRFVPLRACFVAGTPVQMATGQVKHIEDITAGDEVATRDPATGVTESKPVLHTWVHTAYETITAQFADAATGSEVETITATPEHPFFVAGQGWVGLGQLGIGTEIVTRAGPNLVVKSLVRQSHPEGVPVYNFEVETDHTYFVGTANSGIWVHNQCNEITLGLDPHFKNLAQQTGAAHWRQWAEKGIIHSPISPRFGRVFHQAANSAERIHFALDDVGDIGVAVRKGSRGFFDGNMTNAELHYIMTNPTIRAKTTFYRGGVPVTIP